MAKEEKNKFAPGVFRGLYESLPYEFDPGAAAETIAKTVAGPVGSVYDIATKVLPATYNALNSIERPTPAQMAEAMQGRFQQGGFTSEPIKQPEWKDVPMPASAGSAIIQPTKATPTNTRQTTNEQMVGPTLPLTQEAILKAKEANQYADQVLKGMARSTNSYQFEPPDTRTQMTGTGVPGIYQMPDGTYVNTPARGEGGTAGMGPKEAYDRALTANLRTMSTLPATEAYTDMIKNSNAQAQALGQLKELFKPQVATTALGGKTSTVGYDGTTTPVTDNTGAYLQGKKMESDAVQGRVQQAENLALHKERVNAVNKTFEDYKTQIGKVRENASNEQDLYKGMREAQIGYLQKIGMPAELAEVPDNEEQFLFEQQQRAKLAGKKWDDAEKTRFSEYYNKFARPKRDAAYQTLMNRIFKVDKE